MENPVPEDASRRVSKVPSGSIQDRGTRVEKRADDRLEKGGTLNSGGPDSIHGGIRSQVVHCDRRREDAAGSFRESDPLILVRDGRTDHTPSLPSGKVGKAKGRAEGHSKQSTHHGTRILPLLVSSTLLVIVVDGWFFEPDAGLVARLSEEPCAGKPHAGICEGGTR